MRLHVEQAELEHREQAARARADDEHVGLDRFSHWGSVQHTSTASCVVPTPALGFVLRSAGVLSRSVLVQPRNRKRTQLNACRRATARGVCSAHGAGGKELIRNGVNASSPSFTGPSAANLLLSAHAITRNSAPSLKAGARLAEIIAETAAPGPAAPRGLPDPRARHHPLRRHGPPGPRQQRGLSDLFRDRPGRASSTIRSTACRSKAAPPCWRGSRSIS